MSEGISDYAIPKLLDHVLGTTLYTKPTAVYSALFEGDPDGSGTEETGVDYAREVSSFGAAAMVGAIGTAENDAEIDFGIAGSDWGIVNYVGIYDAISAGNLLASGPLEVSKTVTTGDSMKFAVGELKVRFSQT